MSAKNFKGVFLGWVDKDEQGQEWGKLEEKNL
jgi:hypothetical protein